MAALGERLDTLSAMRLVAFLLGLVIAGLSFGAELFSPWFTLIPVVVFFYFVAKFEAVRGRKTWAERAAKFYTGGLDRLAGKSGGAGDGARFADDAHPYSADLDLFGPGSVFERVTACRTRAGEDTLAAWLLAPADPSEVKARQEAVADLTARLDLREAIAVAGADAPAADYHPLVAWGSSPSPRWGEGSERSERVRGEAIADGEAHPSPGRRSADHPRPSGARGDAPPWKRWAVEVLGWLNVLAWIGWLFAGTTALPVIAFGLVSLVVALPLLGWANRVLKPLERTAENLALFESLLGRLERERFNAARLNELQAAMTAGGLSASEQIRELRRILHGYNARKNAFFAPVAILRMWSVRFAYKLEAWRSRSGAAVGQWLRAVGEAESLSSFAGYAYENPADVFPVVLPRTEQGESEGPREEAASAPHPPDAKPSGDLSPQERGEVGALAESGSLPESQAPHLSPLLRGEVGGASKTAPADAAYRQPPGEGSALPNSGSLACHPTTSRPAAVHLTATGVAHPLLPRDRAVPNDVTLGGAEAKRSGPRVLMISGSNMSGKSTLLRAVGVNAVLALAGCVVRATSFTLTPLTVGATMRVQDSLQAGKSRFFAEVTKVRLLLDLATRAGGPPLLFLLDELFSGTNSADRVAGAEGVVRTLVAAGAIGFVTTHDLSLTAVTDTIPGAVNVHFRDDLTEGELHFDYTMRPGVVPHGNGLALMRAVGLKV